MEVQRRWCGSPSMCEVAECKQCMHVNRSGEGTGGDGPACSAPAAGASHACLQRPAGQGALSRPAQQRAAAGGRARAVRTAFRLPPRMVRPHCTLLPAFWLWHTSCSLAGHCTFHNQRLFLLGEHSRCLSWIAQSYFLYASCRDFPDDIFPTCNDDVASKL